MFPAWRFTAYILHEKTDIPLSTQNPHSQRLTFLLLLPPLPLSVHLFPLPLQLPHRLLRTILTQLTLIINARPLGLPIGNIHHPPRIEHVTARREILLIGVRLEMYERGEEQDHVAALVHDGRAAVGAGHFAGEFVHAGFFAGLVPAEVVVPVGEVYVGFVEYGGPLEGGAWIEPNE